MNLNHLAIFHAVAEEGGISRAAERLHISQPAVSKQLREFEQYLGMVLFDRLPKGVRLTEAGTVLALYAKRLFAVEAAATRAMRELADVHSGSLALGASTTIGGYLLPSVLAAYHRAHPAVQVSLEIANTEQTQQKLLNDELDLGFTEGFVENPDLEASVFFQDDLVAVAPPEHPVLQRHPICVASLAEEPWILREPGSGTRAVVERAFAGRGLNLASAMSLGSTEAIKGAVAAGAGMAWVSRLTVERELEVGSLVVVPITDLAIQRPLHCVSLRNKHRSPAVEAFLEVLKAYLTTAPSPRTAAIEQ